MVALGQHGVHRPHDQRRPRNLQRRIHRRQLLRGEFLQKPHLPVDPVCLQQPFSQRGAHQLLQRFGVGQLAVLPVKISLRHQPFQLGRRVVLQRRQVGKLHRPVGGVAALGGGRLLPGQALGTPLQQVFIPHGTLGQLTYCYSSRGHGIGAVGVDIPHLLLQPPQRLGVGALRRSGSGRFLRWGVLLLLLRVNIPQLQPFLL